MVLRVLNTNSSKIYFEASLNEKGNLQQMSYK